MRRSSSAKKKSRSRHRVESSNNKKHRMTEKRMEVKQAAIKLQQIK